MNLERIHAIFVAVRDELDSENLVDVFKQLLDSLQSQISQPQVAGHQEQVSAHLDNLKGILARSPSNQFSPAWKTTLDDLDFTEYLGDNLLDNIDEIFRSNQITPSMALDGLKRIFDRVETIHDSIDSVLGGLSDLNLEPEELNPGECEIGILIPRAAIDNRISNLSKELREICRIFETFEEISTGQRTGLGLRSLSTTDPSVLFDALPKVAAFTAIAVERIIALYKKLLETKKLRMEIRDQGIEEKNLKGIDDHINEVMKKGIEKLVPELMSKCYADIDRGRRHELENSLRMSLNGVANRIDRGFNIEVRAEPLEESADETEESDGDRAMQENIELVHEKSHGLQFIKGSGEPILSLPEINEKSQGD
ncbi:MAG: hypothetical protein KAT79_02600 [candidate division Zixibacteria bacterium]|nr:hypothetical protein [candidate division Zixibacteria bacterium]